MEKGANYPPLRIMVPTAGLVPAKERATYILKIAKRMHAEVYAIHIIEDRHLAPPSAIEEAKSALLLFKTEGRKAEVSVTTFLEEGKLVPTLLKFASKHKIDMIIMGSSKDQIVAEWIVSDVKNKTDVPVVIVPFGLEDIF
jgi:nucleotide-binding universal stress UspA family protein